MTYWYIRHTEDGPIALTSHGGWESRHTSVFVGHVCWRETHFASLKDAETWKYETAHNRDGRRIRTKAFMRKFRIVRVTRKSTSHG